MTFPGLEPAGVEAVVSNLNKFLSDLGRMNNAMGDVGKKSESFANQFNSLGTGVLKVAGLMAGVGVAAVGAMTAGFIALGKQALDETVKFEKMEASIAALSARELINAGQTDNFADALKMAGGMAEETLGWIQKLAIQSPFDAEGVTVALRTAMAYGFTSDRAKQLTEAMINFSAATGGTTETMNSIALALGQIQAKGKLSGQEILQLTNAGIGVNKILEGMGFTLDDVSAGLVDSDKFIQAVIDDMNVFGGAAKAQATTWGGLLNSLGDIKSIGLREFFGGIFDAAKPFMVGVVEKLSSPEFFNAIGKVGEAIGKAFSFLLQGNIKDALGIVGVGLRNIVSPEVSAFFINLGVGVDKFITQLRTFVDTIAPYVNQALEFMRQHWEAIKGALIGIGAVLASSAIVAIISGIGGAIAAIGAPILALIGVAALLGAAWSENWFGIRDTLTAIWEGNLKPALEELWKWLSVNVPKAIDRLSDFWANVLQPAIKQVWDWMSTVLIPWIRDTLYPWLKDNLTRALQILGNFWTNTLWPAIKNVWNWLSTVLIPFIRDTLYPWLRDTLTQAIQTLSDYWTNTLKPAIESVWRWINENLVPLFEAIGKLIEVTLTVIIENFAVLWEKTLKPALEAVWKFISDNVLPIFQDIGNEVDGPLKKTLEWLSNFLNNTLKKAWSGITDSVQWLIDKIKLAIEWMGKLKPSKEFESNSPTPFEMGIRGITRAMKDLASIALPTLAASLQVQPVMANSLVRAPSVAAQPVINSPSFTFENNVASGIDVGWLTATIRQVVREEL